MATKLHPSIAALCAPEALAILQASPEHAERARELGLRNRNGRIFEADVIEAAGAASAVQRSTSKAKAKPRRKARAGRK